MLCSWSNGNEVTHKIYSHRSNLLWFDIIFHKSLERLLQLVVCVRVPWEYGARDANWLAHYVVLCAHMSEQNSNINNERYQRRHLFGDDLVYL